MDLVDHSPHQPEPIPRIASASNLVLIDNYDSFTWNVYQYLVLEGATVKVYRNDEISLAELTAINPTQLVISPGPGHPSTDAGISTEAIQYFSGKIPVLGVCMGEQCIFSAFGGEVKVTGEILHGKASPLRHDGKGLYEGLPQDLPVTRYHSLAGTHSSLPDCLEVTSWIASGPDGDKGIIMGVRHRELLVEGVQFHPESILTAEGRHMLKNFLKMKGGTWTENEKSKNQPNGHLSVPGFNDNSMNLTGTEISTLRADPKQNESILEKIYRHRRRAVEAQKLLPSLRPADLQHSYRCNVSPSQISFPERLKESSFSLSLMAEIKRASPSKGNISLDVCAAEQARKYALAGASVISVLTEPEWFKGGIEDLRTVRQVLEGMPNRPAVLRKEFIFEEYQILEARLAGADTVLLIVKMLEVSALGRLYHYSRKLGMEPLVEVNTVEEMDIATKLGAKVIGVNNRNLTNFKVDLDTTSRLMEKTSKETIVCALSGISGPKDVEDYKLSGVGAVLVGEALMRATNITTFVDELLGDSEINRFHDEQDNVLVKICGTRTPEAAKASIEAGADLIGIILVEGRKRYVSPQVAVEISKVVHELKKPTTHVRLEQDNKLSKKATEYFDHTSSLILRQDRAMLVGVFQNQPLSHILVQQKLLNLDIVQLHGSEPIEWASLIPVPTIRRFGPEDPGLGLRGYHALPLLDSAIGGTGQTLDVDSIRRTLDPDRGVRVILAGGLNPENVRTVLKQIDRGSKIVAVDVSSGVEEDGIQNVKKIREFVRAAKAAYRDL
ncbi:bifunctional tryptophan synthase trp1 [Pseudocyphellaria aurata]|nr:bifunctional tryptophan synthase trp1 [Pseudocyphellaria aurata]